MAYLSEKISNGGLAIDIDKMILEYLIWSATKALFGHYKEDVHSNQPSSNCLLAENQSNMVDVFLRIFKFKHSGRQMTLCTRQRLSFLRYSNLFFSRPGRDAFTNSSLMLLRSQNAARARLFKYRDHTLATENIFNELENAFENRPLTSDGVHSPFIPSKLPHLTNEEHGADNSVFLLDTLPLFMESSAPFVIENSEIDLTTKWMELAGEYMLQSVLEQYLVRGAEGLKFAREAFAWGLDAPAGGHIPSNIKKVDALFTEDGLLTAQSSENTVWNDVLRGFLSELCPKNGNDMENHIEDLLIRYPRSSFYQNMSSFLSTLLSLQPLPVLAQFESGSMDSISETEMRGMEARIGNM